jgi:lipopolysaccharide transport system ATP-binding protein
MGAAVITDCVSKKYRLLRTGDIHAPYRTLRDEIVSWATWPLRWLRGESAREDFWALKDVSFEVQRGEVVGVIGRNGAGKSTLLKILSRITRPSSGRVRLRGRVGSLLEVGTGFHPELTGRENIYLSGAVLGMTRAEIRRRFDEIVAFAEIEKFLDTQAKRYSSGMYTRLAFAVAAHLEPEILLVDEVLAVGDAAFQKKCLGKMSAVAKGGRTVLFVSHNMGAVARLCQKGIVLDHGQMVFHGPITEAVDHYVRNRLDSQSVREFAAAPEKRIAILRACLLDHTGQPATELDRMHPFQFRIQYRVSTPISGALLVLMLETAEGSPIWNSADTDGLPDALLHREAGKYETTLTFPGGVLSAGTYSTRLMAIKPGGPPYDERELFVFQLHDPGTGNTFVIHGRQRAGCLALCIPWDSKQLTHATV